ncbi:MAG: hypothetical protein RMZ43_002960 [Nostoc sp. CmiVER01]|uniref:hypothetical protein n=1 Tax=Nostoc sp. CmiVER01 TaxID=3075384 RepID=UPI002AD39179|nr:hypothetical protein [Nostoc sp. CmiVER01]MDZ8124751.1 hypothetical protein [Nostoc sp. CmiVER01]
MTYNTTYFGELNSNDSELITIDNISVVSIVRELEMDMMYYGTVNDTFLGSLVEIVTTPQKIVKYYDGEDLEVYTEAARPTSRETVWDYVQEIPFQEYFTALQLTSRAVQLMTADEIAGYVQAKLTSFQKSRFSSLRQAIFNNTNRVIVDSLNKYQTTSLPFYNSNTSVASPSIRGYNFVPGDLQHYSAVATANAPTLNEVRTKLIDKVRHHGFRQLEIWVSDYDYSLELLTGFVAAEGQIGRNIQIATGTVNGERQRQLSPFEGLIGFISNVPIIKTPVVPVGYALCIATDGGPNRTPLLSRQPQVASLAGLQVDVKSTFALENTNMTDGWGFAPNHRGAAAVLQLNATNYTAPNV